MTDEKTELPAEPEPQEPEGPKPEDPKPGGPKRGGPKPVVRPPLAKEIGGAPGPEPTRYGDWQHKGRVTDF